MLSDAGYETVVTNDPKEALLILKEQMFDLVILDYNMPGINGLQLMEELVREASGRKSPPVIFATTETGQEERDKAKRLGVKGWLIKPVREDVIISGVKNLIG